MIQIKKTKKRVFLINPPLTLKQRHGLFAFAGYVFPSMGLCSLASVLRKQKEYDVEIIDFAGLKINRENLIKNLLSNPPEYVGITSSTCSIFEAANIAKELKSANNNIRTIIGGAHVSCDPIRTMEKFPQFDFAVIGEGEETICELLTALEQGNNLSKVNGIAYRDNNKIIITEKRKLIKDLNALPFPAWELLPNIGSNYRPSPINFMNECSVMLVTSRGCPHQCIFCDHSVFGNRYRALSPEYVFEMIKELYTNFQVRGILFEDDDFAFDRNRVMEICKLLIKNKLKIRWTCVARLDSINEKMLIEMKNAGCWLIKVGLESGSQSILDLSKRNISLEKMRNSLKIIKKVGLYSLGGFIIGLPGESMETIKETMNFIKVIDLNMLQVTFVTPFPGSEFTNNLLKEGKTFVNWQYMTKWFPTYIPDGFTKSELQRYYKKIYILFYLRIKTIIPFLRLIKNFRNIITIFIAFFVILKIIVKRK